MRWLGTLTASSTGARAVSRSSAGCTSGRWPAIGSSPRRALAGDPYHVGWTHLSAIQTGFGGNFRVKPSNTGMMIYPGMGHCVNSTGPGDAIDPPIPELNAYEESILPEVEKRLGPRLPLVNPIVGTSSPTSLCCAPTPAASVCGSPRA